MGVGTGPMPSWLKAAIFVPGLLLALLGLPILMAYLCVVPFAAFAGAGEDLGGMLAAFVLLAVTIGAGGVTWWHGLQSLHGRPSRSLRLPPAWLLAAVFGLCVVADIMIDETPVAAAFLFPPIFVAAAALPSLVAISWFTRQQAQGLTWRRGLVAFAGGATAGVVVAAALEILVAALIIALVLNLGEAVSEPVARVVEALAGGDVAAAITDPGFTYVLVQIAVIAPLVEEITKPLVALPVIGRLGRREAFVVAAMAGAGFAALENVLYAGLALYLWPGILLVRAVGAAIHPLGAGLVGLAWRDILNGEERAWPSAVVRLAIAAGMHAAWNGGSLLVITLAGAHFFGDLPPEISILGLPAAGTTLAFLIVLGLATLWLGRAVVQRTALPGVAEGRPADSGFVLSDRAVAIWSVACLVAIVPAGITVLRLLRP